MLVGAARGGHTRRGARAEQAASQLSASPLVKLSGRSAKTSPDLHRFQTSFCQCAMAGSRQEFGSSSARGMLLSVIHGGGYLTRSARCGVADHENGVAWALLRGPADARRAGVHDCADAGYGHQPLVHQIVAAVGCAAPFRRRPAGHAALLLPAAMAPIMSGRLITDRVTQRGPQQARRPPKPRKRPQKRRLRGLPRGEIEAALEPI